MLLSSWSPGALVLLTSLLTPSHALAELNKTLPQIAGYEDSPWYFHTGQDGVGISLWRSPVPEGEDPNDYPPMRVTCELDPENKLCFERVYFFSNEDIQWYVNQAAAKVWSEVEAKVAHILISAGVATTSGKTAWGLLVNPVPSPVTKFGAVGAGLVAAFASAMGMVEGWELKDLIAKKETIDAFLPEQETYRRLCGHPRKDFLEKGRSLGIFPGILPKETAQLLPPRFFFEAHAKESTLIGETRRFATVNDITLSQAYREHFLSRCGHLSSTDSFSGLRDIFDPQFKNVPESLKKKLLAVSQVVGLKSEQLIELTGFPMEHWPENTYGVATLLDELSEAFQQPSTPAQEVLTGWVRNNIFKIVIKRDHRQSSWLTRGHAGKRFEIKQDPNGSLFLFLNVYEGWFHRGVEHHLDYFWEKGVSKVTDWEGNQL